MPVVWSGREVREILGYITAQARASLTRPMPARALPISPARPGTLPTRLRARSKPTRSAWPSRSTDWRPSTGCAGPPSHDLIVTIRAPCTRRQVSRRPAGTMRVHLVGSPARARCAVRSPAGAVCRAGAPGPLAWPLLLGGSSSRGRLTARQLTIGTHVATFAAPAWMPDNRGVPSSSLGLATCTSPAQRGFFIARHPSGRARRGPTERPRPFDGVPGHVGDHAEPPSEALFRVGAEPESPPAPTRNAGHACRTISAGSHPGSCGRWRCSTPPL